MRRWAWAGTAVLVLAATTATFLLTTKKEPESRRAIDRLFATTLDDQHGQRQALAQWRGKLLVVNFWATWCSPCREEIPFFSRLHTDYAAQGVQFVGIAVDSAEAVRAFAAREQISFPLLVGGPGIVELSTELGNHAAGLPFTLILDRNGEPVATRTGRLAEAELENLLRRQLSGQSAKMP